MEEKKIRLSIESDFKNVALVGVAVNRLCGLIPGSAVPPYDIELCVVEAVNNCIEHAYDHRPEEEIDVILTLGTSRLVAQVCDRGRTMAPDPFRPSPSTPAEGGEDDLLSLDEQGRGIAIIKEIMDEVYYEKKEGKNCLTMIRYIPVGDDTKEA